MLDSALGLSDSGIVLAGIVVNLRTNGIEERGDRIESEGA